MFIVCSWNVRGLSDPCKRRAVKCVVTSLRKAIICLQETKPSSCSLSFLRTICGSFYDKFQLIEARGASGGILTCWSSRVFSCSDVYLKQFFITTRLTHLQSGVCFYLTNVYEPPSWEGKENFCDELALLKGVCNGCLIICGDFNFTRSQLELKGKTWSLKASNMFNDLIRFLELIDLPMKNQAFTWLNMQNHPTLAKLDPFLVSTEWDQHFLLSEVYALPRITSDHCPILLSSGGRNKRNLFRLEEVWLRNDDFVKNIPVWWAKIQQNDSAIHSFNSKLLHCRKQIKRWCATTFYCILKSKSDIKLEIRNIDELEETTPPIVGATRENRDSQGSPLYYSQRRRRVMENTC